MLQCNAGCHFHFLKVVTSELFFSDEGHENHLYEQQYFKYELLQYLYVFNTLQSYFFLITELVDVAAE